VKIQRLLVGLTLLNLALLLFLLLSGTEPLLATGSSPVLRGNALEIVDDRGRVRASIKVQPAGSLLRLTNRAGREQLIRP
jgi:hypothetical protein